VLGRPIAHSLSPLLHSAAYDALGLNWRYDAIDIGAQELAGFVAGLGPEWAGLSLTMPLKEIALALLDSRSEVVDLTGVANTIVLTSGIPVGHNTDVGGIIAALGEVGVAACSSAVVLGGGSTGRSALAAVAALGCRRVTVVSRSEPVAALEVASRLGLEVDVTGWQPGPLLGAELVISAVPAGAADGFASYAKDVRVLLDVVYDPWPTEFALSCEGTIVGGSRLLLHQAAAQVMLMTGQEAPLAAMAAALDARSSP